jgi:hypothetical protein
MESNTPTTIAELWDEFYQRVLDNLFSPDPSDADVPSYYGRMFAKTNDLRSQILERASIHFTDGIMTLHPALVLGLNRASIEAWSELQAIAGYKRWELEQLKNL